MKSINLVWLTKVDLSNLNAGEGSSNVTELKTYQKGTKPYLSGQSVRHAIREGMKRENPDKFKCVPESPCGDIANCWLCDVFGYLNPQEEKGADRRWSPLKVSPALGLVKKEIVTDKILRLNQPDESGKLSPNLAYIQMVENIYKIGVAIDIDAIGKRPKVIYEKKKAKSVEIETAVKDSNERKARMKAVLNAIKNLADFAKQARNMVSFSPDIVLISVQGEYNHRLQRALELLELKEDLCINIPLLKAVLTDVKQIPSSQIFVGYTPGILTADGENAEETFKQVLSEKGLTISPDTTPAKAIQDCIAAVDAANLR